MGKTIVEYCDSTNALVNKLDESIQTIFADLSQHVSKISKRVARGNKEHLFNYFESLRHQVIHFMCRYPDLQKDITKDQFQLLEYLYDYSCIDVIEQEFTEEEIRNLLFEQLIPLFSQIESIIRSEKYEKLEWAELMNRVSQKKGKMPQVSSHLVRSISFSEDEDTFSRRHVQKDDQNETDSEEDKFKNYDNKGPSVKKTKKKSMDSKKEVLFVDSININANNKQDLSQTNPKNADPKDQKRVKKSKKQHVLESVPTAKKTSKKDDEKQGRQTQKQQQGHHHHHLEEYEPTFSSSTMKTTQSSFNGNNLKENKNSFQNQQIQQSYDIQVDNEIMDLNNTYVSDMTDYENF